MLATHYHHERMLANFADVSKGVESPIRTDGLSCRPGQSFAVLNGCQKLLERVRRI